MTPGALEEAGKFANSVAAALGSQPMTLAMIVTNIMLIVFMFYSQNQFYDQRQELSKMWITENSRIMEMLSRCVVPKQTGGLDENSNL